MLRQEKSLCLGNWHFTATSFDLSSSFLYKLNMTHKLPVSSCAVISFIQKIHIYTCSFVRVLTYLWYTYEYILLASFDKSNHCSNPWFYFVVLWAFCSFHYCWIIPSNNPTPLIQYFTRQIIHPYSNTCICQLPWILRIELFLLIWIVTPACAYLYTYRGIEIVMQSAGV